MTASTDSDFERLLTETEGTLRAYLAGMGIGATEVDDLTQEAYLAFFLHPEQRPPDVEPLRWLKGISRNLALVHLRSRARGPHRIALLELLSAADTNPGDSSEEVAILRRCMEGLPEDVRRILDWYYRDGEATDRIALRLSQSGSAVRKLLIRTREILYACLQKHLGRDSTA